MGSITTRPLAFPGSFIGINTKGYLPRCGVISPQGQMPTRAFEQTSDLFVPPGFVWDHFLVELLCLSTPPGFVRIHFWWNHQPKSSTENWNIPLLVEFTCSKAPLGNDRIPSWWNSLLGHLPSVEAICLCCIWPAGPAAPRLLKTITLLNHCKYNDLAV